MSKSTPTLRQRKYEKPFQDKLNGTNKKENLSYYKNCSPLPATYFLSLLGLIIIVFAAVIVIEKQLPIGLKIEDENKHPNRFIAERSYNYLKKITSLGPRIAGSHVNEVLAVNLLKSEIEEIIKDASENNIIELDVQRVSGDFALEFLDGMTNVYRNLQNVVVKVGSHIKSMNSLLINCHYDTVVDSPGASDDGAGCAVMLEMLRVISKSEKILRHNIIFLFNGGEENFLPASHGFITQHKWAKEVRAFINLEACGAGGREVLFQAGPNHPWILETYAEEVPYPYATSLAQEIFQSGVIPGDTDYRIFRDFGNISGLDFAWSSNGYVYHTKYDTIEQIPLGSLQRTGDNILALARGMAQGHQLSDVESHRAGNLVFFDFLGAFVIRWPMFTSDLVNIMTVILSVLSIYSNIKESTNVVEPKVYVSKLGKNIGAVFLTLIMSVLVSLAIALFLNAFGRTMSWYARPLWAFFLYVIPSLLVSMAVLILHAKRYHKDIDTWPWTMFQLYYDAYQLIWTIVLTIGIIVRIRSSFIALLWVIFACIGNFMKSQLFRSWKDGRWLLMHIAALGLPFVQSFYLIIGALYLFIPIMGRAGAGNNSELMIAVMVSFLFVLHFSFVNPIILLVKDTYRILNLLFSLFLLSVAVLLLTPLGFPYAGDYGSVAPQRFMIAHSKRTFHDYSGTIFNESTGYWIIDMDINSPHTVDRHVPDMINAVPVIQDCENHLYCGLPYLVPVLSMIWKTHWIPGPKPHLANPVKMKVNRREKTAFGERLELVLEGPAHMGAMLSPVKGVELIDWNLESKPLLASNPWQDRKTYFIFYGCGATLVPFNLTLEFKVSKDHEGPILDMAVTSHYLFGPSKSSRSFKNFINQFPPWTAVTYWTATYESWIL